ncbi:MAG: Eco29kI family restriction endonuclease, partial [Armatimonadota bacterium]
IYYQGDLECYAPLVQKADPTPIYVGSAEAKGGRKGESVFAPSRGYELSGRLGHHAASIDAATNLRLEDFRCRYLVVLPAWIVVAERIMLTKYQPLWNRVCDGFGMKNVGNKRLTGRRPRWDTLHPGRFWSENMSDGDSLETILQSIDEVLCGAAPPEL